VIASEDFRLLSKHYKIDKRARELGDYIGYYDEYEDFFLYKAGAFYPVKKKKDAIKVLGVEKKAIRENLTRQRIYYNKDRRKYLTALLQLANSPTTDQQ